MSVESTLLESVVPDAQPSAAPQVAAHWPASDVNDACQIRSKPKVKARESRELLTNSRQPEVEGELSRKSRQQVRLEGKARERASEACISLATRASSTDSENATTNAHRVATAQPQQVNYETINAPTTSATNAARAVPTDALRTPQDQPRMECADRKVAETGGLEVVENSSEARSGETTEKSREDGEVVDRVIEEGSRPDTPENPPDKAPRTHEPPATTVVDHTGQTTPGRHEDTAHHRTDVSTSRQTSENPTDETGDVAHHLHASVEPPDALAGADVGEWVEIVGATKAERPAMALDKNGQATSNVDEDAPGSPLPPAKPPDEPAKLSNVPQSFELEGEGECQRISTLWVPHSKRMRRGCQQTTRKLGRTQTHLKTQRTDLEPCAGEGEADACELQSHGCRS